MTGTSTGANADFGPTMRKGPAISSLAPRTACSALTRDMKFDDPSDLRSTFPRFTKEAMEANFAVVDFLKELAERKSATPAQIALAWLLSRICAKRTPTLRQRRSAMPDST